ncbi:MAG: UDP-N-acetyl glucosamine 2-epimerase, partial [Gammaproteobacteria bacterium]
AGLRSFDRSMPEEINRVLTDQISDLLFTTEKQALFNLEKEGIDKNRVHFVGNVMIDNLKQQLPRAVSVEQLISGYATTREHWKHGYALLTMHRPSNVDDAPTLRRLLEVVNRVSRSLPVIFPMHPRTRKRISDFGLERLLDYHRLYVKEPLGYLEMLGLMAAARVILTDSGGIQEESTSLGVPCLTLRENTERPITVTEGTNTIVGTDAAAILKAFDHIIDTGGKAGNIPEKWDGNASQRIVEIIESWLPEQQQKVQSQRAV